MTETATRPPLSEADREQLARLEAIVARAKRDPAFVPLAQELNDLAASVGALRQVLGTGFKWACFDASDSKAIAAIIEKCRARARTIAEARS